MELRYYSFLHSQNWMNVFYYQTAPATTSQVLYKGVMISDIAPCRPSKNFPFVTFGDILRTDTRTQTPTQTAIPKQITGRQSEGSLIRGFDNLVLTLTLTLTVTLTLTLGYT